VSPRSAPHPTNHSAATSPDTPTPQRPNATPPQFFQKDNSSMNDAFMLATGVAALYLVFKVFEQIETL
jgi:hypothetical protein